MAEVFLDTNYFIDAVDRKRQDNILGVLKTHKLCLSALTIPNFFYIYKQKVPNKDFKEQIVKFDIVDLTKTILDYSSSGPTKDIEDNIQLHSAAEAECDYFLTSDKELLDMKFFGKVKIKNKL